jgi:7-cyano-7-deazaguanine synthase
MKAVVLLSGGVDSTTLLYDVVKKIGKEDVFAISFNYGQKHSKEIMCARQTCEYLGVSHKIGFVDVLGELAPSSLTRENEKIPEGNYQEESMKSTVVPNRNMVLLSLCASYAIGIGATELYYGAHGGDHAIYPDCREEFVSSMKKVLKICDWNKVNLHAPYLKLDKAMIVKKGIKLGVDFSNTWTCYQGKEKACGVCGSCNERLAAFKLNNVVDPIKYQQVGEQG